MTDTRPSIAEQRAFLSNQISALTNRAYAAEVNSRLNAVQAPIEPDEAVRKELVSLAARLEIDSRQLYAAAAECRRILDDLPDDDG